MLKRWVFVFVIFVLSCSSFTPQEKSVREFLDSYYVMADLQKAQSLTTGVAEKMIQKEVELLEGVNERSQAYKTRDIEFQKIKEIDYKDEFVFLYELTLHFPNLNPEKRNVAITVDKKSFKIKFFGEMK